MQKKKPTRKEKVDLQKPLVEVKQAQQKVLQSQSKLKWMLGIFVAAAGFLLYVNTIHFDFTLDDYSVIKENRLTRQGWQAIPQIFKTPYRYGYYFTQDELYRPIPKAIFAAAWAIAPDSATPGHLINVLLYAATGLLLFFTLSKYIKQNLVIPFVASLLFIAHPIHTEVVSSIKSVDEILSLFFVLLTMNFIHSYLQKEKPIHIILALVCFLLSLLSKESGITFFAVVPLAIYFFTDAPAKKNIRVTAMMLIPVAIFLLLRHNILDQGLKTTFAVADNLLMAAHNGADRFATAVLICGIYLKLLFFPHPLIFDRSFNQIPIVTLSDWKFIVSLLAYIAMFAFALFRFKKKDGLSFSILYYLVTISIFSNIVLIIGTSFGERLMYLPSLGFCLAIAFLASKIFFNPDENKSYNVKDFVLKNVKIFSIVGIVFILYAFKTETRNVVWKDNYTLFSNDVKLAPNSTRTHYYFGNLLAKPENLGRKDSLVQQLTLDTAIAELKKSVEIHPVFADPYNQLGVSYYRKKNIDEAFTYYSKALQYNPTNATYHSNMGTLYFEKGDMPGALNAFKKAVELDPNYTEGLANLGSVYGMMKDYDNAIKYLLQCIKTSPDYKQAYYFLSITYGFKGDKQNADFYMNKYKSLGGN
ncbi:MAG: tetratricopeptide repeat protein [Bacteroidia bacterium]